MIKEINEHISIGGNGFAQIKELSDELNYGCKAHFGIARYINAKKIEEGKKQNLLSKINDELMGITSEDRIFEDLPTNLKVY